MHPHHGSEPTFVVTKDGDVDVHASIAEAAAYMEAVDVRAGEYESVFTMDGERLDIVIVGDRVDLVATGRNDLAGLRARLRALGERNGDEGDDPEPRQVLNDAFAHQWKNRWPRWPAWLDRRLHGVGPRRV